MLGAARVMQWVSEHGVRVPKVSEVDDRDLVIERIDGVTMMEACTHRLADSGLTAGEAVAVEKLRAKQ